MTTPSPRLPALRPLCAALALALSASAQASANGLVISQIYTGGVSSSGGPVYTHDYIEIFNAGSGPLSLNGLSVQYGSATGNFGNSSGQIAVLPNVTLAAGQYFLIVGASGTTGASLPASADLTQSGISMQANNGKVALVTGTTGLGCGTGSCDATQSARIIDRVSYGTANLAEGSAVTGVAVNNGALRNANGCTDTDNNAADFTISTSPLPRNAASPLNTCGATTPPIVPSCPAATVVTGVGGVANVTATDSDSVVNTLAFFGTPPSGFTLGSFTPAGADGGTASGVVNIDSSVTAGSYPLTLQWSNDDAQTAQCTLTITVSGGVVPIYTIQGTGATSPYNGQQVTTQGIVTKLNNNGYYLQDATGDGLDTTSDGIFVFTSSAPTVSVGQLIQITATVTEFDTSFGANPAATARPVTELINASSVAVIGSGSITPKVIYLPEAFDDELERYEGMLVTIATPLTASQNFFQGRYGQVTLGAGGRLTKPTNLHRPGTVEALALQTQNNRSSIVLDDGSSAQNVNPTPYIGTDNTLRAGDTVASVTGVIDYGPATNNTANLADYRIHPTQTVTFTRANDRPASPPAVGGNVKVASFNVLNYFNGDGAGGGFPTSRGASNLNEFNRQRAKIVAALSALNADVVGLMEIENDGTGATSAIQDLVNGLNTALGAGTYAVVPAPATGYGTDEIKVALIYKPGVLSLSGAGLSDTDAIHNRPPVAQGFTLLANGEKFSVVVNHFKSKGCSDAAGLDTDQGDGQGCYNDRRKQQANRLLSFVDTVQTHVGDDDVLVIGDLNAYGKEDPIHNLTQGGLTDLVSTFGGGTAYSYVFDGEAGYLDHALSTDSLDQNVTGTAHWHINADEPSVIDYNTEFKIGGTTTCPPCSPDYYAAHAYRSSDHDAVVIGLNLVPQAAQTISFPAIANQPLNATAIALGASASSGLAVSYSSLTPLVCTTTPEGSVSLLGVGTCTLAADQAGSAAFLPAAQVTQSFQVTKATQSLSFDPIAGQEVGSSLVLGASASSGLPVTYTSDTPAVCTVSVSSVSLLAAGTCQITASQPGDAVYEPADSVTQTFTVSAAGSGSQDGDVPIGPFWLLLQALGLGAAGLWMRRGRRVSPRA